MTLSQIAEGMNAPVSSIFGLVRTMTQLGYLYHAGDRKELYPTRRMLQNATVIAGCEPIISRFTELLEDLRDDTRETVILGQMNAARDGAIYLLVVEGRQTIRYSASVGEVKPLHSSSIGKCLLSQLKEPQLSSVLKKLKFPKVTDKTLLSLDKLTANIESGRKRGYQMTKSENVEDVGAIAMPVGVYEQTFAIAVAGPIDRILSAEKQIVEKLARCIANVSEKSLTE